MRNNFDRCLALVLAEEGGYSDHPSDPGGATNLGITRADLSLWRGVELVSKAGVKALGLEEATAIYRAKYWSRLRCDNLAPGVDLIVFDCAVNQGETRAKRFLQQSVKVTADGVLGPITLDAIMAVYQPALINEFAARRMQAYANLLPLFKVFGTGWSQRLMFIHYVAQLMQSEVIDDATFAALAGARNT